MGDTREAVIMRYHAGGAEGEGPLAETELDCRDLICPMPVLKARKALKSLQDGDVLTVIATDPAAEKDLAAFCEATGNRFLGTQTGDQPGEARHRVQKAAW